MKGEQPVATIAWDVDDVLAPTLQTWLARSWTPRHPGAPQFEQLTANPPHALLGVSRETYHASLDAFRRDHYLDMEPAPEVVDFFRAHGHRFRHVALTATPRAHAPTVARWVLRHFGDWIRGFGFVPSWRPGDERLPTPHRDKGAWLRAHGGASVLLDDSPDNVASAEAAGVEGWLVGQPWNDGPPLANWLERLAVRR